MHDMATSLITQESFVCFFFTFLENLPQSNSWNNFPISLLIFMKSDKYLNSSTNWHLIFKVELKVRNATFLCRSYRKKKIKTGVNKNRLFFTHIMHSKMNRVGMRHRKCLTGSCPEAQMIIKMLFLEANIFFDEKTTLVSKRIGSRNKTQF